MCTHVWRQKLCAKCSDALLIDTRRVYRTAICQFWTPFFGAKNFVHSAEKCRIARSTIRFSAPNWYTNCSRSVRSGYLLSNEMFTRERGEAQHSTARVANFRFRFSLQGADPAQAVVVRLALPLQALHKSAIREPLQPRMLQNGHLRLRDYV